MRNWRDSQINVHANIRDALRAMNKGAQKVALVCDDSERLIAIVSDGDIRRGLLCQLQMSDPVSLVANTTPRTGQKDMTRKEIKKILENEDLVVLPILDEENRVVNLHTLASISERQEIDNPVFIMAGGFGTRLKPLTDNCPKPMLPIGDKPMLHLTIERMKKQGFRNFYISTHYLPEKIEKYFADGSELGVNISYIYENTPLGTGGALSLLPADIVKKSIIVLNGDILTDIDFAELLESHDLDSADATICLRQQETSLAYGVVKVNDGQVTGMVEKPTYYHLINAGIYVLSPSCIASVEKQKRLDLPSLLVSRIEAGFRVKAYKFYGKWIDIGQIHDYLRAQKEFNC